MSFCCLILWAVASKAVAGASDTMREKIPRIKKKKKRKTWHGCCRPCPPPPLLEDYLHSDDSLLIIDNTLHTYREKGESVIVRCTTHQSKGEMMKAIERGTRESPKSQSAPPVIYIYVCRLNKKGTSIAALTGFRGGNDPVK